MKKLIAIVLLAVPCMAGGPKYVGTTTDPQVYQEFQNVYHDIASLLKASITAPLGINLVGGFSSGAIIQIGAGVSRNTAISLNGSQTSATGHGFGDYTTVTETANGGYASFETQAVSTGGVNTNHMRGFQGNETYAGTSTMGDFQGFANVPVIAPNAGAVSEVTDFYATNVSKGAGSGTLTNQYGFYAEHMTGATNNYGYYAVGPEPSYFGGGIAVNAKITGFRASAGSTAFGGVTTLVFPTSDFDTASGYGTGTGVYTAPTTGYYNVHAQVSFTGAAAAGDTDFLIIEVNGSNIKRGYFVHTLAAASQNWQMSVSALISLTSGDLVKIGAYSDTAKTMFNDSGYTWFEAFLVK